MKAANSWMALFTAFIDLSIRRPTASPITSLYLHRGSAWTHTHKKIYHQLLLFWPKVSVLSFRKMSNISYLKYNLKLSLFWITKTWQHIVRIAGKSKKTKNWVLWNTISSITAFTVKVFHKSNVPCCWQFVCKLGAHVLWHGSVCHGDVPAICQRSGPDRLCQTHPARRHIGLVQEFLQAPHKQQHALCGSRKQMQIKQFNIWSSFFPLCKVEKVKIQDESALRLPKTTVTAQRTAKRAGWTFCLLHTHTYNTHTNKLSASAKAITPQ